MEKKYKLIDDHSASSVVYTVGKTVEDYDVARCDDGDVREVIVTTDADLNTTIAVGAHKLKIPLYLADHLRVCLNLNIKDKLRLMPIEEELIV